MHFSFPIFATCVKVAEQGKRRRTFICLISIAVTYQNFQKYFSFPIFATCLTHFSLDLIIRMIFGEKYRAWSSLLCSLLHYPVALSFSGPNILLSTIFSKTHILYISVECHTFRPGGSTCWLSLSGLMDLGDSLHEDDDKLSVRTLMRAEWRLTQPQSALKLRVTFQMS